MASSGWEAQQDHHMTSAGDDDFQQFLDMSAMGGIPEGMQFDFNGFQDANSPNHMLNDQTRDHAQESMMGAPNQSNMMASTEAMMPTQTPAIANPVAQMPASMMHNNMPTAQSNNAGSQNNISDIDAQIQYLQQQKFHQQQRQMQEQRVAFYNTPHGHSVPPTPQSFEMPPGSAQFFSPAIEMQQSGHFEGGFQQRAKEDMSFTPLVSPAVTPHFNMDNNFTVPGAYFSPLTSPALRAQNDNSSVYDHSTRSNNSPNEHSPLNIDNAMVIEQHQPPQPTQGTGLDLSRKARKNNAAKATRAKATVRSSPISKPMRKKTAPSPAMMSQVLTEVEERNLTDSSMLPLPTHSTDGSEDASVSPENLTDMPPPPVPARRSSSKSPYIHPQNGNTGTPLSTPTPTPTQGPAHGPVAQLLEENQPHPATPASLMRLASSKSKHTPTTDAHDPQAMENIESLELGESVSNRDAAQHAQKKQPARIDTSLASQFSSNGPHSSKTPASQVMASPSGRAGSFSATQSPQLRPGGSSKKTPQLAPKGGRRGSTMASPALLPRISPNIKPLLPSSSGMSVESTASMLLTSKSNYQNILEGNSVPGVSYPSELSTGLTSKRTSHKIAEQGRRNRINSALQVMASLLPERESAGSGDEEEKKESKAANAANSKASVVENAIVHMKSLKQENSDLKDEVQNLRKQLEELKSASKE